MLKARLDKTGLKVLCGAISAAGRCPGKIADISQTARLTADEADRLNSITAIQAPQTLEGWEAYFRENLPTEPGQRLEETRLCRGLRFSLGWVVRTTDGALAFSKRAARRAARGKPPLPRRVNTEGGTLDIETGHRSRSGDLLEFGIPGRKAELAQPLAAVCPRCGSKQLLDFDELRLTSVKTGPAMMLNGDRIQEFPSE